MYNWRKSKENRVRTCKCGKTFEVDYPSNPKKWCDTHCKEMLKQTAGLSKQRFIDNNPMHNSRHRRTQAKMNGRNISKLEKSVIKELKSNNIKLTPQFPLGTFSYDIYIEHINLLVEVNGDYWHCNPEKYPDGPINDIQKRMIKNDKRKMILAKDNGYNLLTIWEKDVKDGLLNKILTEYIYSYTNNKEF